MLKSHMGRVSSKEEADLIDTSESVCVESQKDEEWTERLDQLTRQEFEGSSLKRKFIDGSSSDLHLSSPKKSYKGFPCTQDTESLARPSLARPGLARPDHVRCLFPTKRKNSDFSQDVSSSKKFREDSDDQSDENNFLLSTYDQSVAEDSSNSEIITSSSNNILTGEESTDMTYFHKGDYWDPPSGFEPLSHLEPLPCRLSGDVSHHRSPWTSDWFASGRQLGCKAGGGAEASALLTSSCSAEIGKTGGKVVGDISDMCYRSPWTTERFISAETGSSDQLTSASDGSNKTSSPDGFTSVKKVGNKTGSSDRLTSNWFSSSRPGCIASYSSRSCPDSDSGQGHLLNEGQTEGRVSQDCVSCSRRESPWTAEWFSGQSNLLYECDNINTDQGVSTDVAVGTNNSGPNNRRFSTSLFGYLAPSFWPRS